MNFQESRPTKPGADDSNSSGRTKLAQTLARSVDRTGETCHPWIGGLDPDGYGVFYVNRRAFRAHRAALSVALDRDLSSNEIVRHSNECTTRACCNPAHLSVGTHADNVADREAKGTTARADRHYHARLTSNQVAEIRELCSRGTLRHRDVAELFGVGREAISKIVRGENWKHAHPAQIGGSP